MAWTPQDLTNPSFVRSNLSAKDRSTALYSVNNELTEFQASLRSAAAALTIAQDAANNGPERGEINALKAKANDPSLSPTEREQASQQAAALADQRDKLNVAAENALQKLNNANNYYDNLVQGKRNLVDAGTVEPGVNLFATPPGYDGRSTPAAQVPNSQNPNSTPTTASEELESASPKLIDPINDPTGVLAAEDEEIAREQANVSDAEAFTDLERNTRPIDDPTGVLAAEDAALAAQAAEEGDAAVFRSNEPIDDPYGILAAEDDAERNNRPIDDPTGILASEDAALAEQAAADDDAAVYRLNEPIDDPYGILAAEDAALAEDAAAAGDAAEFERLSAERSSTGALNDTRSVATKQDAKSFEKAKDWRVRLSLAPNAKYLYKADNPGILKALQATNGVIFPYTPTVNVVYAAAYDASELIHSNYKIYNYKNSSVDTVSITGEFTAQDTNEANYLLAVIHFFKSVTKMFYGQDQNPRNGTPPPLVYMSGMGTFQFDNHPLAVTNFTYSLPNEVDYIRVGSQTNEPGSSTSGQKTVNNTDNASSARIQSSNLGPKVPNFQRQQSTINSDATYVPTKMQISITCIPIVTRNDISNNFSLQKYATGALLQGSKRNGGGIW